MICLFLLRTDLIVSICFLIFLVFGSFLLHLIVFFLDAHDFVNLLLRFLFFDLDYLLDLLLLLLYYLLDRSNWLLRNFNLLSIISVLDDKDLLEFVFSL